MVFRLAEQRRSRAAPAGLASVDFVLDIIELLANTDRPRALSDIARTLGVSKPRVHRHLRALLKRGYVRQDSETDRYQVTARLLALGESVREQFEIARVLRPEMSRLRDATGQTVTASTLVADQVTIIDMVHGRTSVAIGYRPGAVLDPFASAHGLVALSFGPEKRIARAWPGPKPPEGALADEIAHVRARGWATAADRVLPGVNALAAPIFDHNGAWCAAIAIVGLTADLQAKPAPAQIREVARAAREVSRRLGAGKSTS